MTQLTRICPYTSLATLLSWSSAAAYHDSELHARVLNEEMALKKLYDYVVVGAGTAELNIRDRLERRWQEYAETKKQTC